MASGRVVAEFIAALAVAVRNLTDDEIREIIKAGDLAAVLKGRLGDRTDRPTQNKNALNARIEAEKIMKELSTLDSRESAAIYLTELHPNRATLVEAAKIREIHVLKADTNSAIVLKLIENVVGSRLDSAAIRGGATK